MSLFVTCLAMILGFLIIATLWAVVNRRGVFDRIVGIGMIGTKTTILLAFTGILFDRPEAFVDIAMTYAVLNFIVTLAVAKYFKQRVTVE